MARTNQHYYPIILGFVFLLGLSGCRFGNYSEDPKRIVDPNASTGFKSVELFFAHAKQLETAAVYNDGTATSWDSNVSLASVPTSILDTFSDPVYFATPADASQVPMFVGKNQKNYIDTELDANGDIKSDSASDIVQLWRNPACQTQVQISQVGTFDRTQAGSTVLDGVTQPVSGKLKMELTYIRVIDGDCVADLREMAQCYLDSSTCSTDDWRAATNFFDLYVRQSGALKIEDAIRIKGLAYVVHFE
jgi:hypothetical protein